LATVGRAVCRMPRRSVRRPNEHIGSHPQARHPPFPVGCWKRPGRWQRERITGFLASLSVVPRMLALRPTGGQSVADVLGKKEAAHVHGRTVSSLRFADGSTMLVVTRRSGQSILIGHDIEIVIVAVEGSQIRVGIKAPRNIPVARNELRERGTGRGPVIPAAPTQAPAAA
jgi:carbon storage regulator